MGCDMKFKFGTIKAVMEFKHKYPYSVGDNVRFAGMGELIDSLNEVYGLNVSLAWKPTREDHSYDSRYEPSTNYIIIVGKLSIITFLHEYAHALNMNEHDAILWSLSLFRRCYPIAFCKLIADKHLLIERSSNG